MEEVGVLLGAGGGKAEERKVVRPKPDEKVECPRCKSGNTKFCYYNNYSMSQPRYLCKACRRYWTHGGSLRNVPIGGGCRKNSSRRSSSKIPFLAAELPMQPAAAAVTCFPNVFPTFVSAGFEGIASFLQSPPSFMDVLRSSGDHANTMATQAPQQLLQGIGTGVQWQPQFDATTNFGSAHQQHGNNIVDHGEAGRDCYNWSNEGWQGLINTNNSPQL